MLHSKQNESNRKQYKSNLKQPVQRSVPSPTEEYRQFQDETLEDYRGIARAQQSNQEMRGRSVAKLLSDDIFIFPSEPRVSEASTGAL